MVFVYYLLINNFLLNIFSRWFIFLFKNNFNLISLIYLLWFFVFVVLVISSFYDLKYYEIPNNISLFLILFGLIFNFILSLIFNDSNFITSSIIWGVLIFCLSYVMGNFGFWGGGDVKIFTGLATSTSVISFMNIFPIFSIKVSTMPFVFLVIINGILISFPVILIIIFKNYFKLNKSHLLYLYKSYISKKKPLIGIFKYKNFNHYLNSLWNFFCFFIPFFIFNFFLIVKEGSKKKVAIGKLKEGMILDKSYVENINFENSCIINKDIFEFLNEINELCSSEEFNQLNEDQYNLQFYFNEKCSKYFIKSVTAGGLTKEDINLIKTLYAHDLIGSHLIIKESIPFLPFIVLSFIVVSLWGGLF